MKQYSIEFKIILIGQKLVNNEGIVIFNYKKVENNLYSMLKQYLNIIVHLCSSGLGKTGGAFFFLRYWSCLQEKLINQTIMDI